MLPYLRSALFDLLFYGWTLLASLIAWPLAFFRLRPALVAWARIWLRAVECLEHAVLNLRGEIRGRENLPPPPYIVAMQHQSAWETLKLLLWFDEAAIVMKEEILRAPVFGACVRMYGCIPVTRSRKPEDLRRFLRAGQRMAEAKRPIVVFPQGTRDPARAGRPLQKGVAVLYEALKIPVVPVTLDSGRYWRKGRFVRKPGVVRVTLHPLLPPGLARDELLARLQALYASAQ